MANLDTISNYEQMMLRKKAEQEQRIQTVQDESKEMNRFVMQLLGNHIPDSETLNTIEYLYNMPENMSRTMVEKHTFLGSLIRSKKARREASKQMASKCLTAKELKQAMMICWTEDWLSPQKYVYDAFDQEHLKVDMRHADWQFIADRVLEIDNIVPTFPRNLYIYGVSRREFTGLASRFEVLGTDQIETLRLANRLNNVSSHSITFSTMSVQSMDDVERLFIQYQLRTHPYLLLGCRELRPGYSRPMYGGEMR
jgi:hypothetical protein